MIFLLNYLFIISSHPITLLVITILQTFIISYTTWSKTSNSWLPLILFLIFIGGLIVLFIYIVRLASNETFNIVLENNKITTLFIATVIIAVIWSWTKNYNTLAQINFNFLNQFNKIYSSTPRYIIMFVIFYLLLTLIVAVKISNLKEAPVKNIFY